MKKSLSGALLGGLLLLSACSDKESTFAYEEVKNPVVDHIHGTGFINGGTDFVIATHAGLYSYGNDGWTEANREKNDYMGFQPTEDGFFASGHPAVNSDMKNPFGLMKSTDKGASFEQLAFYGEIDFHYLGAGYLSNAVYVFNETPAAGLEGGLNYTVDEGKTWTPAKMEGYTANTLSNVAVHPSDEGTVAMGSEDGLFLSADHGDTFEKVSGQTAVTYVTLTEDGGYYASLDQQEQPALQKFTNGKEKAVSVSLPEQLNKPIQFIAVNPENPDGLVITSYDQSIYETTDAGTTWRTLAEEGTLKTAG